MELRLYLYDMGKKLLNLVKTPLNVGFLLTDVWNSPLSWKIFISRKESELFCSCLMVNLVLGYLEFM